jgi:hypothetical protein
MARRSNAKLGDAFACEFQWRSVTTIKVHLGYAGGPVLYPGTGRPFLFYFCYLVSLNRLARFCYCLTQCHDSRFWFCETSMPLFSQSTTLWASVTSLR